MDGDLVVPGGFLLSLTSAVIYGVGFVRNPPSWARSVSKTASIGVLALVSALVQGPLALTAALALGALGDAFLSRSGQRNFLLGLISFLVAHIAYIALFWANGSGLAPLTRGFLLPGLGLVFVLSAADTLRRLWANLDAMRWPVLVYTVAIGVMGLAALTMAHRPLVLIGAIAFMMSDTVLAYEEFHWSPDHAIRRYSGIAIWLLYFGGQALIAWAFLADGGAL